jgi:hypothetical protein
MDFALTPDEAQATALAVRAYLRRHKYKTEIEPSLAAGVPRPTVVGELNGLKVAVEAQQKPSLTITVKELLNWANINRVYMEVYIAAGVEGEVSGHLLKDMKRLGFGLMLIDGQEVEISHKARNPALIVTPEPTLRLGRCKSEVRAAVSRFNDGDRKPALGEMCEVVERETDLLCRKLSRKEWIDKDEATVEKMDWSNQINVAASSSRYVDKRKPIVNGALKDDLHSFRGARNLIDHKVRSKREDRERQRQFAERMMMGPRLTAELLSLQRRVK